MWLFYGRFSWEAAFVNERRLPVISILKERNVKRNSENHGRRLATQRFGAKDGPLCLAGPSAGWAPLVDFKGWRVIGVWRPPRSTPWLSLRHSLPAPRCLRTVPTGRRKLTRKAWQFSQRFGVRVRRTWGEGAENLGRGCGEVGVRARRSWGEGAENFRASFQRIALGTISFHR